MPYNSTSLIRIARILSPDRAMETRVSALGSAPLVSDLHLYQEVDAILDDALKAGYTLIQVRDVPPAEESSPAITIWYLQAQVDGGAPTHDLFAV